MSEDPIPPRRARRRFPKKANNEQTNTDPFFDPAFAALLENDGDLSMMEPPVGRSKMVRTPPQTDANIRPPVEDNTEKVVEISDTPKDEPKTVRRKKEKKIAEHSEEDVKTKDDILPQYNTDEITDFNEPVKLAEETQELPVKEPHKVHEGGRKVIGKKMVWKKVRKSIPNEAEFKNEMNEENIEDPKPTNAFEDDFVVPEETDNQVLNDNPSPLALEDNPPVPVIPIQEEDEQSPRKKRRIPKKKPTKSKKKRSESVPNEPPPETGRKRTNKRAPKTLDPADEIPKPEINDTKPVQEPKKRISRIPAPRTSRIPRQKGQPILINKLLGLSLTPVHIIFDAEHTNATNPPKRRRKNVNKQQPVVEEAEPDSVEALTHTLKTRFEALADIAFKFAPEAPDRRAAILKMTSAGAELQLLSSLQERVREVSESNNLMRKRPLGDVRNVAAAEADATRKEQARLRDELAHALEYKEALIQRMARDHAIARKYEFVTDEQLERDLTKYRMNIARRTEAVAALQKEVVQLSERDEVLSKRLNLMTKDRLPLYMQEIKSPRAHQPQPKNELAKAAQVQAALRHQQMQKRLLSQRNV